MNGESESIEFKRELSDKVDVEKEVIAFLNSRTGGVIRIGVDDDGNVIGLADADGDSRKIKDRLKNNISPSVLGLFDMSIVEVDGKRIVEIVVAAGCEKPYYKAKYGLSPRGCFERIGTAAEPMRQGRIDQLLAARTRNSLRLVPSPRSAPHEFSLLGIYYSERGFERGAHFLENLDLYTPDGKVNYVGYLLADVNSVSFRVAKYADTDKCNLVENNEYGYTCIIRSLHKVLDKLDTENRTFARVTGRAERDQWRMFDPTAIREAVVNAVLHTDWTREVSPVVEIYSDRIAITSCGGLPDGMTREEFLSGRSMPRNRELMRVFRDLELAEQLGSGMRRILSKYPPSVFETSENFISVVFPFRAERQGDTISENVARRKADPIVEDAGTGVSSEVPVKIALKTSVKIALENKFAGFSSKVLGNAERVLVFLGEHESATFEQIAAHVGATRRTAVNYVNLLKERGFIRRIGPDKGGHWEVVEPEPKTT